MLRQWWTSWFGKRNCAWIQVIMYTRHGCPLCDEAWQSLQTARRRWGFQLRAIHIDQNEELQLLYGHQIPVVTVNGKVRFRGRVNPVLLDRLLRAEAPQRRKQQT